MPRIGAATLVFFAIAGPAGAAWECRTPHFQVISEPGAEIARSAAEHLEAVRGRYHGLGLLPADEAGGPVLVMIFADQQGLYPYTLPDARDPALTGGLSLRGEERGWMAVAWQTPGSPWGALAHEYAHLLRDGTGDPLWLREGVAEYLAGLEGTEGGPGGPVAYHLLLLQQLGWIDWQELLAADRFSPAFGRPSFYSQAWLAVHWLVARGIRPADLRPGDFEALLREKGTEWIQSRLDEYADQLRQHLPSGRQPHDALVAQPIALPEPSEARLLPDWEFLYLRAEFHREQGRPEQARPLLEALERDYPQQPEPSESLGALEMAAGRYEQAESKLRAAILKGSQKPSTHHRYSLMLLRPLENAVEGEGLERAGWAVWHARQARQADPWEPRYALGEAQALMVAGRWDESARLLSQLGCFAGWRERAEAEFAELIRRRQQSIRSIAAPELEAEHGPPLLAQFEQARLPAVRRPAPPPEPPFVWPPPGTVLLYGYINGVECRATEKIVRVRTPRFTFELREKNGSPARLYHAPRKWQDLPCGLSGYEVNVVYRPLPPGEETRGELVAVVF